MTDQITFTVAEANGLLGWLADQLDQAAIAAARAADLRAELNGLRALSRSNGHGDVDQRISDTADAADREARRADAIIATIQEQGIVVRDITAGLVDFPGERDERRVWLCWKAGEPEVGFWHETDIGFAGRRPL